MAFPIVDIQKVLGELDGLFGQVDGTIYDTDDPATMAGITAERNAHQAKIDAKFQELQSIVAAWASPAAWEDLRQTHPDLLKELRVWIGPSVPDG